MSQPFASHELVHAEPFAYCAHPFATVLADGTWLLVFNRAPRRPFILHPPQDPWFHNVLMRSGDRGRSWSAPSVVPDFGWSGVECAGLTALRSGEVLLNQWRFRWYPLPLARKLEGTLASAFPREWVGALAGSYEGSISGRAIVDPERLVPWARGLDGAYVHRSTDGGLTWGDTVRLDHAPFVGAYGLRGGVELAHGTLLMPFSDVPNYATVFVQRSGDGGHSWEPPIAAAALPDHLFEEPAPCLLPDGRVLLLCRDNVRHTLSRPGRRTAARPGRCPGPPASTATPAICCGSPTAASYAPTAAASRPTRSAPPSAPTAAKPGARNSSFAPICPTRIWAIR